jgi:hypothetical protein
MAEPVDHGRHAESQEAKTDDGLDNPQRRNHRDNFTAGDAELRPLRMICEVHGAAIRFLVAA